MGSLPHMRLYRTPGEFARILVPVPRRSYWLMITLWQQIISGDGFLGLGSMLSLIVLIPI